MSFIQKGSGKKIEQYLPQQNYQRLVQLQKARVQDPVSSATAWTIFGDGTDKLIGYISGGFPRIKIQGSSTCYIESSGGGSNYMHLSIGTGDVAFKAIENAITDLECHFGWSVSNNFGYISCPGSRDIQFWTGGSARWKVEGSGNADLLPETANTMDLGDGANEVREIYHCGLTAGTCADFSQFTLEELISIVSFNPDPILYERMKSGEYLPHIDMNSIHPILSGKLDLSYKNKEITEKRLPGLFKKQGNVFVKTEKVNKKGDKTHIDFENLVYALVEIVKKQNEKIEDLETQIESLKKT